MDDAQFLWACLMLLVCGVTILLVLHIVVAARLLRTESLLRVMFAVAGWVFVIVGFFGISGPVFLNPLGILFIVFLMLVALATVRFHAARRNNLLWSLAIAAERKIPLASAARGLAEDSFGVASRPTRRLAELLEGGTSLSVAMQKTGRLNTDAIESMVLVGDRFGAVPKSLRAAATSQAAHEPLIQSLVGRMSYLFAIVSIFFAGASFMMWKIFPALGKIFDDFDTELPDATLTLFRTGQILITWGVLVIVPAVVLGVFVFIYALCRYLGLIRFDVFVLSRFTLPLHRSNVLKCLAIAAEMQRPLDQVFACLAEFYPRSGIRQRLLAVLQAVDGGQDWREAMKKVDLLRPAEAAVLQAAARTGNLDWALREMANSTLRRYLYQAQIAVQVAGVVCLLVICVLGYFFVVGVMMPIMKLWTLVL